MLLAVTRHRHISPLGRNLRRYRYAQGWSQQELADRSGVSRVTIARLESGAATSASVEIAERLADALGISLAELTADPELVAGAARLAGMVDRFVASG
ncbi:MAG: helix-turn-helix domain-containing protein, partial [Gammaproteobacteria bacterium]